MTHVDPFPPIVPGTLLAERSEACPDCAAGIRFMGALPNGRPWLQLEHDDGCPMLARIEREAAERRARGCPLDHAHHSPTLRGTR